MKRMHDSRPRLTALAALCLFMAPACLSAEAIALSVDEAVDLALRNNLGIKAERLKLDEKKWQKAANWNVFLPKASLTAAMYRSNLTDAQRMQPDYSRFGDYMAGVMKDPSTAANFPIYTVPRWGAQFLLDVEFGLSRAQFLSVKQTSIDYRMGLVTTQIAEKRLVRDVKKLYYSLLLMHESLKVLEDSRDLAERRVELVRAREKIGSSSEIDVLAEETGLEAIRPQIIEEDDSYETALANFKLLLGVKRNATLSLTGDLEIPRAQGDAATGDEASVLAKLDSRLDLAYLRGAIDALKNKLALDVSGMTPSLFVKWTADPTFQKDIMDSSTWSGGLSDNWKQSAGALSFGVSLPLDPFLPGSKTRTDAALSRMQVEEAQLGYRQARDSAEIEILSLLRQLDKSTKLMAASEKSVALAERLYAAAEKAYGNGSKNYLELQDALGKLNAARFERLRDKHGYLTALGDLEYALTAGDFAPK